MAAGLVRAALARGARRSACGESGSRCRASLHGVHPRLGLTLRLAGPASQLGYTCGPGRRIFATVPQLEAA